MKEIGIEKLAELLKEYSYENHDYYWTLYVNGKFEGGVFGTDHDLSDEEMGMIIKSKEYGFIKRIIDNDKIDRKKYDRVYINTESGILGLKDYEQLLMLLSISQNPISDLISYLK